MRRGWGSEVPEVLDGIGHRPDRCRGDRAAGPWNPTIYKIDSGIPSPLLNHVYTGLQEGFDATPGV